MRMVSGDGGALSARHEGATATDRLYRGGMNDPFENLLIQTKLLIPRRPQNSIARPRLVQKLHLCTKYRLTYIYSPIGFGKTTLLGEWQEQTRLPVAWISLDERDNSTQLFLLYILNALNRIDPGLCAGTLTLFSPGKPFQVENVLTSLLNEISQSASHIILVLDDFHTISNPEIHRLMAFLLAYQPYQVHLVITSRKRLPFSLAELRAKNDVLEITTSDLRFTHDETTAFLRSTMDLNLPSEDIALLENRTEGWITGLQLAAHSLRETKDLGHLLDHIAGDNQVIADYLFEEIFSTQSEDLRDYLLKTSILNQMSASLCDAVTLRNDSAQILRAMGESDLLVFPLDARGEWYIRHQIFSDFLRATLDRDQPGIVSTLHQRAAEWYQENGILPEAVHHAAQVDDMDRITAIIEANSQRMLARGEISTLQEWLALLPYERILSHERLLLTQAWILTLLEGHLDEAEQLLTYLPPDALQDAVDHPDLIAEVTAIRANIACLRGDAEQSINLSNKAMALFYHDDTQLRGQVISNLSRAYRLQGDFQSWSYFIKRLEAISRTGIDYETRHHIIKGLATLYMAQGELIHAVGIWREGLDLVAELDQNGLQPVSSIPFIMLGKIYYEWNRLDECEENLRRGLEIASRGSFTWALRHGYINLARTLQVKGFPDEALATIEKAIRLSSVGDPAWTDGETRAYRAWLWLINGQLDLVSRWVRESDLSLHSELEHCRKFEYLVFARYLLVKEDPQGALTLLSRLRDMAARFERTNTLMEILPVLALASYSCGQIADSISLLEKAIMLGIGNRYTRTFLDAGPGAVQLLRTALAAGVQEQVIMDLLHQGGEDVTALADAMLHASSLSYREIEILRLLALRHSSTEIADRLDISIHTARTHIRNIYSKLNVHSKAEMIDRAKELDLI